MAEHTVITTDAEIETALERAKLHDKEPLARTVEHVQDFNLLLVGLSNGRRLVLPIEDVQGLGVLRMSRFRTLSCSDVERESAFRILMSICTSQP